MFTPEHIRKVATTWAFDPQVVEMLETLAAMVEDYSVPLAEAEAYFAGLHPAIRDDLEATAIASINGNARIEGSRTGGPPGFCGSKFR